MDSALLELVRAFDASGSGLLTSTPTGRQSDVIVCQVGGDPSAQVSYNAHYGRLDYVAQAVGKAPIGRIHTGTELILPNTHTESYADWCRPSRFEDGLFVRLTGGTGGTWLGIAAPRGPEPFGTADRLTLIRRLVSHLQQAIRTRAKLAGLEQREHDLVAAIEQFHFGIVIVGPDGRVRQLNSAADGILVSGDGLRLRPRGAIAASLPRADRELHRLVYRAVAAREGRVRSGGWFCCPRPSGRCGYTVHVIPLDADAVAETAWSSPARENALVLIVDPDATPDPDTATLRRLYSLTGTEAQVAIRVARGDGLKPVAEELSVSMTTIRTHLQHIFDKTGMHRQAELVQLLMSARISTEHRAASPGGGETTVALPDSR